MYSSKRNIQQLVSLMLKSGITDVVVCPGSRNAPLVHTFAAVGMHCYEVTDERSAGFFALGLIEAKEKAVAVCCTSGSAVLNLAPAVAEAYYRPLPLLVITADRPACWIGQMDGQTIPQLPAFGQTVRKVVNLPESSVECGDIRNSDDAWYANRLVNEALLELERTGAPVHINVPISEPHFDISATELPDERIIHYCGMRSGESSVALSADMIAQWNNAKRRMIVAGQMLSGKAQTVAAELENLDVDCIVLAEHLSNLHKGIVGNFDEIIAENTDETALAPDLLITFGGHIVSKTLKQWLRKNPPKWHWHISETGEVTDLFRCATHIIEAKPEDVFAQLSDCTIKTDTEYSDRWNTLSQEQSVAEEREKNLDEISILRSVMARMDASWNIHVANSCMVRNLQKVHPIACDVHCNRGVNGIEGSLSAAVGYAVGSGRKTLMLIGDLSFFYDQNALWNRFVKEEDALCLRIFLINNGGGKIFSKLSGLKASPYRDSMIAGAHRTTAEGIALENNCAYTAIDNVSDLSASLEWLLDGENGVRILEIKL